MKHIFCLLTFFPCWTWVCLDLHAIDFASLNRQTKVSISFSKLVWILYNIPQSYTHFVIFSTFHCSLWWRNGSKELDWLLGEYYIQNLIKILLKILWGWERKKSKVEIKTDAPKQVVTWLCHCTFIIVFLANSSFTFEIYRAKSFKMRYTMSLCKPFL